MTDTILFRIINRMKVTAIIDDSLINDVKMLTKSSTITEAITIALKDWIDLYKIKELNKRISEMPILIEHGKRIRQVNRINDYT